MSRRSEELGERADRRTRATCDVTDRGDRQSESPTQNVAHALFLAASSSVVLSTIDSPRGLPLFVEDHDELAKTSQDHNRIPLPPEHNRARRLGTVIPG